MSPNRPFISPMQFDDPDAAFDQVLAIYDANVAHLRDAMKRFVAGEDVGEHVRACYPFVRVHTDTVARADSRLAFGFVAGPGTYETTLTRPDLFKRYYIQQFKLLLQNHGHRQQVRIEVGTSAQPIPIHFSFAEHEHIEGSLTTERRLLMRDVFDLPNLAAMDDGRDVDDGRAPNPYAVPEAEEEVKVPRGRDPMNIGGVNERVAIVDVYLCAGVVCGSGEKKYTSTMEIGRAHV